MTRVGKRLLKARKLRGFSQLQLAARTSNTRALISMVEPGRANLSVANLTAAAKALGVSVDFLCGLTTDRTPARQLAKGASQLADSTTRIGDLEEHRAYVVGADYVGDSELPGAAGGGAVVDDERVTGRVQFRRERLARHGLAAGERCVVQILGESMEPTLDGCSNLLNQTSQRQRVGRIYVIRTDDGLVVKRAAKDRAALGSSSATTPTNRLGPPCPGPSTPR